MGRHPTILSQFQEISARTGIPVADLMEARERSAELLLAEVGRNLASARARIEALVVLRPAEFAEASHG
jgi:hypothetical protein